MADLGPILSMLGNAAKQLAPMVVPGAGPAIAAAEALGRAFTTIKQENGGKAPAEAEAASRALFDRVKAHADSTLSRLERG